MSIGERLKPEPLGRPGYLRVDTMHQGDQDGAKGVYHINAVDEVTHWQVVGAVAQIGEAWLITVLERMSERRRQKCRAMDAEENQRQVSLRAPPPLEIADGAIPTFPPTATRPWKSGKPKAGFPLSRSTVCDLEFKTERRPGGGSLRDRLQAHLALKK